MSIKALAFVFFAGMTLVGLDAGQPDDNTLVVLQNIKDLRVDHPLVDEVCIVVAANIKAGNYEEVAHMMENHGRCATRLLDLRVTTRYND